MAHHHRISFLAALYLISISSLFSSTIQSFNYSVDDVNSTSHHACCIRHKKLIPIGNDINGDDYYIDVGQCRHYCVPHNLTDPVHSCSHGYSCRPSSERREEHHVLEGSKEVSVVASCSCYENGANCERQSHRLRLFDDSPYQVDVDTGICRGACSSSPSSSSISSSSGSDRCQPIKNRTESVAGPNGAVCVEVIEECGCTPPCYRMHRTSVYFDFDVSWNASDADADADANADANANASGEQKLISKEIDVGLCVGLCTGHQGQLCVLRDSKDSSKCLMALNQQSSSCTPSAYTSHRLANGRVVLAVSACGC